ncbi:MAG: hypothetical protein A2297_07465 [Elusimicrobia bacterium RIFOXYB2_FULL_48_7]|nr:MAG: hypothetical protein A2297_07465 [Elusimicrobia bacterium RIFOXYB2_FULL_48_7]
MPVSIKVIIDAIDHPLYIKFIGWGISLLVGNDLLFDTFGNARILKFMAKAKVGPKSIRQVFLSHQDPDHVGGLFAFLEKNPDVTVFACKSFTPEFKEKVKNTGARLVEVSGAPLEIRKNIFSSGEMTRMIKGKLVPEQALVIKEGGNLTILTGCAHPGLVRMVEEIKKSFGGKVKLLAGGFHFCDSKEPEVREALDALAALGVEKVAPFHCTGKIAYKLFRKKYLKNYTKPRTGNIITLPH